MKKLTASDLTFFKWHFENNNAGNQKAINLSRNVFIDVLYPSLPDVIAERSDGKIPITLYTYGPGLAEVYPLQRKIIKTHAYKNYRLNGEFIFDPEEAPDRFNSLKPSDVAVMGFEGNVYPTALHIAYLAANLDTDKSLCEAILGYIGNQRGGMKEITLDALIDLVQKTNPVDSHPIRRFILDTDLIQAVQGDAEAKLRAFKGSGRTMSKQELISAKQRADETGNAGEELVASYLEMCMKRQNLRGYEWVSSENAIAPYDFCITDNSSVRSVLDVKTTSGGFSAPLHISMAEVITMANIPERYDLYRVYDLNGQSGKLRIAKDMRDFAKSLTGVFSGLPKGVRVDGISVDPSVVPFADDEENLFFPTDD